MRVEQLYPWPRDAVKKQIARYPNAEVVWCQEEPANGGYWTFVKIRLDCILDELDQACKRAHYVGRKASASPATGSFKAHVVEQETLVNQALTAPWDDLPQPFSRATRLSRMGQ